MKRAFILRKLCIYIVSFQKLSKFLTQWLTPQPKRVMFTGKSKTKTATRKNRLDQFRSWLTGDLTHTVKYVFVSHRHTLIEKKILCYIIVRTYLCGFFVIWIAGHLYTHQSNKLFRTNEQYFHFVLLIPYITSSPWTWKAVPATLSSGRCTLSYPNGRIIYVGFNPNKTTLIE